jgi:hypothetical protein
MQVPVAAAAEGHQVTLIMYGRVLSSTHTLGNDVVPIQVADGAADLTVIFDHCFIGIVISIQRLYLLIY